MLIWCSCGARDEGGVEGLGGVESRESGVGSRESGVGSRESGVGSRESGGESRESGGERRGRGCGCFLPSTVDARLRRPHFEGRWRAEGRGSAWGNPWGPSSTAGQWWLSVVAFTRRRGGRGSPGRRWGCLARRGRWDASRGGRCGCCPSACGECHRAWCGPSGFRPRSQRHG